MDSVRLSGSERVRDGLDSMLTCALGLHELVHTFVEVEIALLIIAVAKLAEDKRLWFPRGKWATIQAIQGKVDAMLERLTWKGE